MKADIHPELHKTTITCTGCQTAYQVRTTRADTKVAICASCHPFFTGQQKFVDTEGRVDRFRRRYQQG